MSGGSGYVTPPLVPSPPPALDRIPPNLTQLDRWLLWRLEAKGDGRPPAKAPYAPSGYRMSPLAAEKWSSFVTARRAFAAGGAAPRGARDFSGLGIVLGRCGQYWLAGIDLDGCLGPDGAALPWAAGLLAWAGRSYAEVSPSQTGVKIFFALPDAAIAATRAALGMKEGVWRAAFPAGLPHDGVHQPGAEIYLAERYFAVTGQAWADSAGDVALLGLPDVESLRVALPARQEGAGAGGGGGGGKRKPRDESGSGRAWRLGLRLIRSGAVAPDIGPLRAALLAADDQEVVRWAIEKGDDRQIQKILDGAEAPEEWARGLQRNAGGAPIPNFSNALTALENAPDLAGMLAYDDMAKKLVLTRPAPGDAVPGDAPGDAPEDAPEDAEPGAEPEDAPGNRRVEDADYLAFLGWMQRRGGMPRMGRETVIHAVEAAARRNTFHPVRDYLDGLTWDGAPRVDAWLCRFAGAEDTPYARKVAGIVLISMVARIYRPGAKVDYVLVLQGDQGIEKSRLLETLAGGAEWFSDHLDLSGNQDIRASMHLRGKWIIEISELHGFSRASTERLKAFITRRVENFVPMYGRAETSEMRQGILVGTTNQHEFLRDASGGRRFLPVAVKDLDVVGLAEARGQLFAEATERFRAGEPWWPDREFEALHFAPAQEEVFEADAWEEEIEKSLGDQPVTVGAIGRAIGLQTDRLGRAEQNRIVACLTRLGWVRRRRRGLDGVKLWIPAGAPNPESAGPAGKKFKY